MKESIQFKLSNFFKEIVKENAIDFGKLESTLNCFQIHQIAHDE